MQRILASLSWCLLIVSCSSSPKGPQNMEFVPLEEEVNVLKAIPAETRILQIADTFHLSREIPLAEQALMRRLSMEREFAVVATSGSPFDAWIAMETLLNGRAGSLQNGKDARLRGAAFLDQNAEFESMIDLIHEVRKSEYALYLTGFDPGFGNSYGWRNQFLLRIFIQSLHDYGVKKDVASMEKEVEPLLWLRKCGETGFPRNPQDTERVKGAVKTLSGWIKNVTGTIHERFPGIPHDRALSLLPFHLEQALETCRLKSTPEARYDASARFLIKSLAVFGENSRMVVNAPYAVTVPETGPVSNVGDRLKKMMKGGVYTVVTVPLAGDLIAGGLKPPARMTLLGNESVLQWSFRSVKVPAFIPVHNLPKTDKRYEPLYQKKTILLDGEKVTAAPAKGADAFLVFPKVKPTAKWYFDHLIEKKPDAPGIAPAPGAGT